MSACPKWRWILVRREVSVIVAGGGIASAPVEEIDALWDRTQSCLCAGSP